ncbi:hypothetical protein ACFW91_24880 [Streptomyces asoensis]|uniref:hypothetical protein n=1 Tax=Streptomyces asoensis TaxID=249586 RepID=UPI0036C90A88
MIIVYTPSGGEPEHYDASTLKVSEASIVQRTVDMKWAEITAGLESDDLEAMRGIVWVLKKRTNPSLRWGDFDPGVTEMSGRLSKAEVEAYIDNAFAMVDTDPDVTHERVDAILRGRLPLLAAEPEHALALLDARAQDPKDPEPEASAAQEDSPPADPIPSPSPTSTGSAAPTSDSSPTSSTSPLPSSTTSPSATSTP